MRVVLAIAFAAALSAFALAQDGPRSLRTANGLLQRGLHEEAAAEYTDAIRALDEPVARDEARYGLALARFNLGDFRATLAALDGLESGSRFAFIADADVLRMHALVRTQDWARASDAASTAVRHREHANWPATAALHVEVLTRADRHAPAIEAYGQHADRMRQDDAAYRRASFFAAIAQSHHAKREADHARAAEWFERAVPRRGIDDLGRLAMLERAHALRRASRQEEAIGAYQRAIALGGDGVEPAAMLALASMLRTRGQADDAADILTDLAERHPRHEAGTVQFELGLALLESGRAADASRALDRAEGRVGEGLNDDVAYWRAKADLRQGRAADAAARLAAAVEEFGTSPLLAEMRYDLAVALQRDGRPREASEAFGAFLRRHPDHEMAPDARSSLASLALEAGALDEAAKHASVFLASHPDHPLAPNARFILGETAYRSGDYQEATRAFVSLLDTNDQQLARRARYRLGMSLHQQGQGREAVEHLAAVTDGAQTASEFLPALFVLAENAFDDERWAEAQRRYAQYLRATSDSDAQAETAAMKLALTRVRQGDLDSAVASLQGVLDSWPEGRHASHARFELGQALMLMGEDQEAERVLQRLMDRDGQTRFAPHALRHLAGIASRAGDAERAAGLYAQAAERGGAELARSIAVDRALALLNAERPQDAAEVLRGIDGVAQAWRVVALSRAQSHEQASALAAEIDVGALGLSASDRAIYDFALARSLLKVGQSDDAQRALARAARSGSPTAPYAAIELAELHLDADRFAEAANLLEPFANDDALDKTLTATAAYKAAWARYQLGDHRAVVRLLDERELGDLAGPGAMLLGESLLALKRGRDAAERFDAALASGSDNVDADAALLRLGEAHAAAQDWRQSQRAYERHRREHPRSPRWYLAEFGIGWALENAGQHHDAIDHYRRVADKHKGETAARAQFQLGECLFALGEHEEAVRELLRVDILHASPKWSAAALYEAGRCFEAMSKVGEARAQYRAVQERFPESDWAAAARERLAAIAGPGGARTSERGG
jgi:TolA-binding protein